MSTFTVEKTHPESVEPYSLQHIPSGLRAGSFTYLAHARAAATDCNALVNTWPDLATPTPSQAALAALLATRRVHSEADRAQYVARKHTNRRKV